MNIIKLQSDIDRRNGVCYEYDADSKPLGEGGMGRVFKGFRIVEKTGEKKPIAIKAIYDNIPEQVVERARREAEIQLENDNLIRMYSFVETVSTYDSKVHYHVIMELLVGVTLEDVINGITVSGSGMQIPYAAELYTQYTNNRTAAIVTIMKSVLSGLMALHDKGYIHRDIDPSNIMVTIDRKIKLIDFGICKQIVSLGSIDKGLTATGVFMGKVNYAAPELVLGDVKNQNYTTDIYALGIIMYQLYAGHLPFSGTDQDILAANLHKPLPMKSIKGANVRRIIRKATEKSQAKRYSSAAEFRVDLEKILLNNNSNSSRVPVIAGVTVILALIAGVLFFVLGGNKSDSVQVMPAESQKPVEQNTDIVRHPSCSELYNEALKLLSHSSNIEQQTEGKQMMMVLANDSLYKPAIVKYNIILLNSSNKNEVEAGYNKVMSMAMNDNNNLEAMFEYGLTLSKANESFPSLKERQDLLGLSKPDLDEANKWMYFVMNNDLNDYRSVYWIINNLIAKNANSSIDPSTKSELKRLYNVFKERNDKYNDIVAVMYKKAIEDNEGRTLRNWRIID